MRFSQNVRGPLDLSFSARKSTHQWLRFLSKLEKPHFLAILGHFGPKFPNLGQTRIFPKNRALSLFYLYCPLTSPEKPEQSHDPIPRTFITHARTDSRTDGRHFIEPNPLRGGSIKIIKFTSTLLAHFWKILEFASSDFDETSSKCSWHEKSDDGWVWSHVGPFLPGHAHYLGPN